MPMPEFIRWLLGRSPVRDIPDSMKVIVDKYSNIISTRGQYSVGVTVSSVCGSFILTNNGGDDLPIDGIGSFTFDTKLNDGASYSVEVKPGSDRDTEFAESVEVYVISGGSNDEDDGSGTINGADVIDINVECFYT